MAFVPEDGTGLANANSYISTDEADAYFSDRGNEQWLDFDVDKKEIYLVQATDYIGLRYDGKFKGSLGTETQALPFPRLYVGSSALLMPDTLKRATAEYALRASAGPLAPDPEYDESGRLVTKKREEVGPIVEEVGYNNSTGSSYGMPAYKSYPVPDNLMKPLLIGGGLGGRLMRN